MDTIDWQFHHYTERLLFFLAYMLTLIQGIEKSIPNKLLSRMQGYFYWTESKSIMTLFLN